MLDAYARITANEAQSLWEAALASPFVTPQTPAFLIHDLRRMRARIDALHHAFPTGTCHALAIKANPLVEVLRCAVQAGAGLEAASLEELHLALAAGASPSTIIYDSPAKTEQELAEALRYGVVINADSFIELQRIEHSAARHSSASLVGLRINPELSSSGTIAHTSVGQAGSKFGVPLTRQRAEIINAFHRYPWLVGLHVHVGSQGCRLEQLTQAAALIMNLRDEIERSIQRPLRFIDLGGGLPTVYREDQRAISPAEYVQALRQEAGALLNGTTSLITEFGRVIQAGCGIACSRVEYVHERSRMAIIHIGADLLLRPVYRAEDWSHEFFLLDAAGQLKQGPRKPINIGGPLCFSGDVIARDRWLPEIDAGDWLIIRDTGAYTLSMWSRHCSRGIPLVLGCDAATTRLLRAAETPNDVVRFWSATR